jgi:hypothetical protein
MPIHRPMDVDELTYPAAFVDARVGRVEERFREWENDLKSKVYEMLAEGRGEVRSEKVRLEGKRQLAALRNIDIAYLSCLIDCEIGLKSVGDVNEIRCQLAQSKRQLLAANCSLY